MGTRVQQAIPFMDEFSFLFSAITAQGVLGVFGTGIAKRGGAHVFLFSVHLLGLGHLISCTISLLVD